MCCSQRPLAAAPNFWTNMFSDPSPCLLPSAQGQQSGMVVGSFKRFRTVFLFLNETNLFNMCWRLVLLAYCQIYLVFFNWHRLSYLNYLSFVLMVSFFIMLCYQPFLCQSASQFVLVILAQGNANLRCVVPMFEGLPLMGSLISFLAYVSYMCIVRCGLHFAPSAASLFIRVCPAQVAQRDCSKIWNIHSERNWPFAPAYPPLLPCQAYVGKGATTELPRCESDEPDEKMKPTCWS